jgi:hypothetical protein
MVSTDGDSIDPTREGVLFYLRLAAGVVPLVRGDW